MKYKIAVCDDNSVDREYIMSFINKWAEKGQYNIILKSFESSEQFLFQYEDEKDYDIMLLDIEMGNMDGVALAKKIREGNDRVQIIFVTGFPDYIAEGYEVDAVHYLMKPVGEEKIISVLDKAIRNLGKKEEVIFLKIAGEMQKFNLREIFYIEVLAHVCTLHTANESYDIKTSITELESKFGEAFIKTHRSFLVNPDKVKRITRTEVILDNGSAVPLARRSYGMVNEAFISHFKKQM